MGGIRHGLSQTLFLSHCLIMHFLNSAAKIIGPSLGANRVVAGNTIDDVIKTIKRLNEKNISATVDNLGEFVNNERDAIEAKIIY